MITLRIREIWRDHKGSVLIALIVTVVILSALGAAMVSLTSTSMFSLVGANSAARAYFLAESGYRYAESDYLNAVGQTAKDNILEAMHNQTYTLNNDEGQFQLDVYPYHFKIIEQPAIGPGQKILKTKVSGGFPPELTLPAAAWLKIGPKASSVFEYIGNPVVAGQNVTFTMIDDIGSHFPVGLDVLYVAKGNGNQTLTKGGSLVLKNNTHQGYPLKNGTFEFNGNVYSYKELDVASKRLTGIEDPDDSGMPDAAVPDGSNLVLQKFVKLHSTGTFGAGSLEGLASREVVYHVPLPTPASQEKKEFHETFDDLTDWESIQGPHLVEIIGGRKALRANITPTAGVIDTSLIKLKWADAGTDVDLAASHRDAGYFLSYDAQTKVGFDPQPSLWEFPAGSPFPELYTAGITFRLNTVNNGYGVSFLRGDNNFGGPADGIPPGVIPTGYIDVSVSTDSDDAEEWGGGNMYLDSTDLEFINDPSRSDQIVGMRFQNIRIPQGSTISSAYIEFETDEIDSGVTNLTFKAQAVDDAPTFTASLNNISSRAKTVAAVAWNNVPAWNIESEKHQTPDLSAIIQEVIDRPGWNIGNSLAVIVTGSGERTAESYNGEAANSPRLRVTYVLNDIPIVTLWQQTGAFAWTWLAYKQLPDGFTIPAGDEATLMVRVIEGAALSFDSGDDHGFGIPVEDGDRVTGQTSLASGVVNSAPIVDSGDWGAGTAAGTLTIQEISGTFQNGETLQVVGSASTASVTGFRARDNYIKVYYGDVSGNGTPNDVPTDDQIIGNPRGDVNWPPDNAGDTAAANDFLQLVQWDVVNLGASGDPALMGTGEELNAIIRSNTFTSCSSCVFSEPELGLHTIGNSSPFIYFDDFAIQTETISGGGTGFVLTIQE